MSVARASLAALLLLLAFAAGGMVQGWRKDRVIADIKAAAARADQDAALALAAATQRVRQQESDARAALQARAATLIKERDHAKTERDTFIDGVRSGAIRLSVPVLAHDARTASADTGAAAGNRQQARAELAPAFAERLAAIATDGDDAIRQLNACIDSYNQVRETFHVQAQASEPAPD